MGELCKYSLDSKKHERIYMIPFIYTLPEHAKLISGDRMKPVVARRLLEREHEGTYITTTVHVTKLNFRVSSQIDDMSMKNL